MTTKIFTVFDSKAGAYLVPFFMPSTGQAIRSFEDVCNDPSTQFFKHAADFTLFEIGCYDDATGSVENYGSKLNLGTAIQFKKQLTLIGDNDAQK